MGVVPGTPTLMRAPRGRRSTSGRASKRDSPGGFAEGRTQKIEAPQSPETTDGSDLPRVCIIGAGSSGIVAAKALAERGIPFDCFEKSDQVGGNWVFGNRNGMSSAYRDLYIDSSRARMEYSDFPMPASYPDFPHHTQIR